MDLIIKELKYYWYAPSDIRTKVMFTTLSQSMSGSSAHLPAAHYNTIKPHWNTSFLKWMLFYTKQVHYSHYMGWIKWIVRNRPVMSCKVSTGITFYSDQKGAAISQGHAGGVRACVRICCSCHGDCATLPWPTLGALKDTQSQVHNL